MDIKAYLPTIVGLGKRETAWDCRFCRPGGSWALFRRVICLLGVPTWNTLHTVPTALHVWSCDSWYSDCVDGVLNRCLMGRVDKLGDL